MFGRYRVEHFLGAGGQAFGFAGFDKQAPGDRPWERHVFLKQYHDVLPSDPELKAFDQRIITLRERLQEKENYICLPKRVGHDHSSLIMVFPKVRGRTLRDWMNHGISEPQCVRFALGLANAVRIIHKAGVVHLDLKPDNVMIEEHHRDGEPQYFIQIIDLDSALIDGVGFRKGVMGTPMYYSPEHAAPEKFGEVSPKSDVFTLGIMLYELLFKTHPFAACGSYDQSIARRECVIPRSDYHRDIVSCIHRALSPDPLRRPTSGRIHFALSQHRQDQLQAHDADHRWKTRETKSLTRSPKKTPTKRRPARRLPTKGKASRHRIGSAASRRRSFQVTFISHPEGWSASFGSSQDLGAQELAELRIRALPRKFLHLDIGHGKSSLVLNPIRFPRSLFLVSRVQLNGREMDARKPYPIRSGDELRIAKRVIKLRLETS